MQRMWQKSGCARQRVLVCMVTNLHSAAIRSLVQHILFPCFLLLLFCGFNFGISSMHVPPRTNISVSLSILIESFGYFL